MKKSTHTQISKTSSTLTMNNNLEQFSQTLYFMVQTGVPIPTVERKGGSYLSFKIENMKKGKHFQMCNQSISAFKSTNHKSPTSRNK